MEFVDVYEEEVDLVLILAADNQNNKRNAKQPDRNTSFKNQRKPEHYNSPQIHGYIATPHFLNVLIVVGLDDMELDEEDYAPEHHESEFYHVVLRSKKESKNQDTPHLIPDIQEVSTGILPIHLQKYYN